MKSCGPVSVAVLLLLGAAALAAEVPSPPGKTAARAHTPWDWLVVSAGVGVSAEFLTHPSLTYSYSGSSYETTYRYWPTWDFKAFVDLTWIQVSVGWMLVDTIGAVTSVVDGNRTMGPANLYYNYVTLAGHLKWPFGGEPLSLFPLLGIEYRHNLVYDNGGTDMRPTLTSQQLADLNELWIEIGAGMDLWVGRLLLRSEMLVGLKPFSRTDRDLLTVLEAAGTNVSMSFSTVRWCVLAGYRF